MKSVDRICIVFFVSVFTAGSLSGNTLLLHAGFEEENLKQLIESGWRSTLPFHNLRYWPEGVRAELTEDVVFAGNKALMLQSASPEIVVNISTPLLKVQEGSKLRISVAMKLWEVVTGEQSWYKARIGYGVYDRDFNPVKGGFKSFVEEEGSRDWTRYEKTTIMPPGAEHFFVYLELKNCRGTAWFDDLKIEVLKEGSVLSSVLKTEEQLPSSEPIIIPKPWKESYSGKFFPLKDVTLITDLEEETAKTELIKFIKEIAGAPTAGNETIVLMGAPDNSDIKKYLRSAGLDVNWKELGEQGYVVYAGTVGGKKIVLLTGMSAEARFYALQTLKQMLVKKDGQNLVHEGFVVDRPLYKIRGAVFGDLRRWYDGPPQKKNGRYEYTGWPYRERFHKLKLNFVWLAGWDSGYYERQVLPLSENDKNLLKDFLEDCRKYFITPCVGLRPYCQTPHPKREKGGVSYSSEEDIAGVVGNLKTMYEIGYRNLFIAFDDLPAHRFFEYEQDKKRFASIGEAHRYFIGEVYRRLKTACPDVKLRVIGVAYWGGRQMPLALQEYLQDISPLPVEIEFVFTSASSDDAIYSSKISGGRNIIIWSNYYPDLYEKLAQVPAIVNPYEGGDSSLHQYTTGHFVLFVDLPNEDAAHISWYTAADYMWNPSAYLPENSAKRALIKSVGHKAYQLLKDYAALINRITDEGILGKSTRERINYLKQTVKELDGYAENLENILSPEFYQSLVNQLIQYKEFLSFLRQEYEKKVLPIPVVKLETAPVIDGKIDEKFWNAATPITGFLNLGTNTPAEPQTLVYMGYDADNLYLAAKMEEPEMNKLKSAFTERDSPVFIDDSLEIFIGSFENIRDYRHIAVNALGTIYDAKGQDETWNGRYNIAAAKQENAWTIEMAIPRESLNFQDKDLLRFNFGRNRNAGGKREHSTYAPLFGRGFHLPQWFWVLQLK